MAINTCSDTSVELYKLLLSVVVGSGDEVESL